MKSKRQGSHKPPSLSATSTIGTAAPRFYGNEKIAIGTGTAERMISAERYPRLATHNIHLTGHSYIASGTFHITRPSPSQKQVLVVLEGTGKCWLNQQWHTLEARNAFLSPTGAPHAYLATGKWEIAWCMFTAAAFPEFQKPKVVQQVNTTLWRSILTGTLEEAAADANSPQLNHWASLLAFESKRLIEGTPTHSLASLWSEVEKSLQSNWTLDALAQKAGVSAETLRLRCLQEKQISPMAYLTRLRMTRAADMLSYGLKVEYVARAVGYENPFSFSAAFHRTMGTPPSSLKPR